MKLKDVIQKHCDYDTILAEFLELIPSKYFDTQVTRDIQLDGIPESWVLLKLDDTGLTPEVIYNIEWSDEEVALAETPVTGTVSITAETGRDYQTYPCVRFGRYYAIYFPEEVSTIHLKAFCTLKPYLATEVEDAFIGLLYMYLSADQSGFFSYMKVFDRYLKDYEATNRTEPKITIPQNSTIKPFAL
jgi:hypothetical protein